MALAQPALKTNLLTLFNLMKTQEMSEEDFANNLATIITDYIKTAQVTTTVTVATPSGPGSGTGTGSLS
jgi:hypothetical protein